MLFSFYFVTRTIPSRGLLILQPDKLSSPFTSNARCACAQYGMRNKIRWQEKSLGARGMLVKVGVNRLLRSRHGDHMVTLHRPQVRPWGNERVADLAHEVRGRAAPQLAIARRFGRS